MTQSQTRALNPLHGQADLYYRHAKGENLLLLGPEEHPAKTPWLRQQIDMFTMLGWKFLILDMSIDGAMGQPHILGDRWSSIERNAIRQIAAPVVVRVKSFRNLLDIMDEIDLLKTETREAKHVVVLYLGALRALGTDDKEAFLGAFSRLHRHGHGVWLSAERFQCFPMDDMKLFETQIILSDDETDIDLNKWAKTFHIEDLESVDLIEDEALCLFRGRSEGANHLYVCELTNRRAWE